MRFNLSSLFCRKTDVSSKDRLLALKEFSLAAPYVLDPEHLMDAVALLEEFGWNAENAARHIGNRTMLDFDEAMMEKGDDPFGEAGENPFPGPAG